MRMHMLLAAGMIAILGGCATYDYAGGQSGGYYRGTPGVQYRYPPGYYDGYYGYPYYGGISPYGYPAYPAPRYDRPNRRPPPRPDNDHPIHRPPPASTGPLPPRPSAPPRPPRPAEPRPSSSPSPWRDLNRIKQGTRPARKSQEP
ncbi:MAG: hypothetical protein QM581_12255 [Pseudomonas sp.]